jgi:flagellar hook protein FlgE
MDVIGNNIANVNTYGFKASRVTFADVYYQTLSGGTAPMGGANVRGGVNPTQIGYGAQVATIDMLTGPTGAATTNRALDVYLAGEGFIVSKRGDEIYYTRLGNLRFDSAGNLVDHTGNVVQGFDIRVSGQATPAMVPNPYFDPSFQKMYDALEGLLGAFEDVEWPTNYDEVAAWKSGVQGWWAQLSNAFSELNTENQVFEGSGAENLEALLTLMGAGNLQGHIAEFLATPPNDFLAPSTTNVNSLLDAFNTAIGTFETDSGLTTNINLDDLRDALGLGTGAFDPIATISELNRLQTAVRDFTVNDFPDVGIAIGDLRDAIDLVPGLLGGTLNTLNNRIADLERALEANPFVAADVAAAFTALQAAINAIPPGDPDPSVAALAALQAPLTNVGNETTLFSEQLSAFQNSFGSLNAMARLFSPDNDDIRNSIASIMMGANNTIAILQDVIDHPYNPTRQLVPISPQVVPNPPSDDQLIRHPDYPLRSELAPGISLNALNPETAISNVSLGPDVEVLSLLSNVNIDQFGRITGLLTRDFASMKYSIDGVTPFQFFANEVYTIGQLALVNFGNPDGLIQAGNSYYTKGANSGEPMYSVPGFNGTGQTQAGLLEMSNVDIAQEFTDMITTQRGFQANTRVITVSDEMLAELVNLKR